MWDPEKEEQFLSWKLEHEERMGIEGRAEEISQILSTNDGLRGLHSKLGNVLLAFLDLYESYPIIIRLLTVIFIFKQFPLRYLIRNSG
jgi:hypothetical protein